MNDLNGKNILITGGAGFIGSNLADYILKLGAKQVVVLDDLSTGFEKNIQHHYTNSKFSFIKGSIVDFSVCLKACTGIDIVLHHAALGSVPRSIENPMATNEVNVNGFVNMLFAAQKNGVERFIYASSSSVYGDDNTFPKTESKTGNLLSPYAVSKYTNEKYAAVFSSLYNIQTVGFRYFNVFGSRQNPNGAYAAVIPKFISALLANKSGEIYGSGENTRDFTYVENVLKANFLAITANLQNKSVVMNIACGDTISVNAIYSELSHLLNKESLLPIYLPERKGEIKDSFADISLASNLINYIPEVPVKEGLQKTLNWYKNNQ